jgi:hypothetical protein
MIWDLISGLVPNLWGYIAAAGAAIAAIAGVYFKGRADAKAKADLRDLKGFKKTTERMQDADAAMGDDPAVLRDRLRNRDPDQR